MSSLALMRWLEETPERYDLGMRIVTFGRVTPLHDAIAREVPAGADVLEIGCGTGSVTLRLLETGSRVTALDQSPDIKNLKHFAVSRAQPRAWEASASRGKSVAIIGAGPAGLSAAGMLARQGLAVTVYDRNEKPGGMLMYGLGEFDHVGHLFSTGARL